MYMCLYEEKKENVGENNRNQKWSSKQSFVCNKRLQYYKKCGKGKMNKALVVVIKRKYKMQALFAKLKLVSFKQKSLWRNKSYVLWESN